MDRRQSFNEESGSFIPKKTSKNHLGAYLRSLSQHFIYEAYQHHLDLAHRDHFELVPGPEGYITYD